MSDIRYCHGCHEKEPCECRTVWYDSNGRVIDTYESKLREKLRHLKQEISKRDELIREAINLTSDNFALFESEGIDHDKDKEWLEKAKELIGGEQ